jgi:hypothetical protein
MQVPYKLMFDRLHHYMWCVIRSTLHAQYMKYVVGNEKQYNFNMGLCNKIRQ